MTSFETVEREPCVSAGPPALARQWLASLAARLPSPRWGREVTFRNSTHIWVLLLAVLAVCALPLPGFGFDALAHGMAGKDAEFVKHSVGPQILPFFYLGAKHMATGYDHLLFVIGTVFFLYRLRHVAIYVTTFSIGHSTTLLLGVLGGVHVNPFLVDAIIGLSVVYIRDLVKSIIVDLNHEMAQGRLGDYKSDLKSKSSVESVLSELLRSYEKDRIRGKADDIGERLKKCGIP